MSPKRLVRSKAGRLHQFLTDSISNDKAKELDGPLTSSPPGSHVFDEDDDEMNRIDEAVSVAKGKGKKERKSRSINSCAECRR